MLNTNSYFYSYCFQHIICYGPYVHVLEPCINISVCIFSFYQTITCTILSRWAPSADFLYSTTLYKRRRMFDSKLAVIIADLMM